MESDPTVTADDGQPDEAEVIEIEVRELRREPAIDVGAGSLPSVAKSAGEVAMSLFLYGARGSLVMSRALWRRAADTQVASMISEAGAGAADAISEELGGDFRVAARAAEERLGQIISVVVPIATQAVKPAELMSYIDVDALLEEVDIDRILTHVDIDALLGRIDIAELLARVDIDALIGAVDLDAIMEQVDLNGLLARVDLDAVLDKVDWDALISRIDLDAILEGVDVARVARSANIGDLVAESTGDVAGSALDLGRRQAVALDTLLARVVNRVLGRDPDAMPQGPPRLVEDSEEEDGP